MRRIIVFIWYQADLFPKCHVKILCEGTTDRFVFWYLIYWKSSHFDILDLEYQIAAACMLTVARAADLMWLSGFPRKTKTPHHLITYHHFLCHEDKTLSCFKKMKLFHISSFNFMFSGFPNLPLLVWCYYTCGNFKNGVLMCIVVNYL